MKPSGRLTDMYLFFAKKKEKAYKSNYPYIYLSNSKVYEKGKGYSVGLPYLEVGDKLKLWVSHVTGEVVGSVNSSRNVTLFKDDKFTKELLFPVVTLKYFG